MKPEIKKKWLIALKSGEYKHVNGGLKRINDDNEAGYCCLGVLTDIYIKETGQGQWENRGKPGGFIAFTSEEGDDSAYLPLEVQRWSGCDHAGNILNRETCLAIINDEADSFGPAIEAIEKYL